MRFAVMSLALLLVVGCGAGWSVGCGTDNGEPTAAGSNAPAPAPADSEHQNVTGPHGDHSPHHGGMVLMNGDVHYEIVFGRDGHHEIWFSDAVRSDLPASVASDVTMEVARPGAAIEAITLRINDTGEAWVASARPLEGEGVMVKVRYALQGEPHEIEVPVVGQ